MLLKLRLTPFSVTVFDHIFLSITLQVVIIFILVVIAFLLVYLLYLFIDSKRKPVELSITADEVIILLISLQFFEISLSWWPSCSKNGQHCPLEKSPYSG